jgi:multidrug efflux system membrane fusion protein
MKLLKWTVALAVMGTLAGVVAYASLMDSPIRQGGRRAALDRNAPVPVLAASARVADVPVYFDGVGTARARNMVTVRPQVDGRIISVNFKEGQDVKRGDVLARIDPASYQAQLDQAVAKKALDEVQLANARRDLERYTKLGGNIVAEKTIDTQRALVGQFEAQIKADDAAIANAKTFLDYTTIVSPLDGRAGIRLVDEGNLVRASDAGIVVITEIRPISVIFTLPQQQLAAVNKALTKGALTVDALDTGGKIALDTGTLQVVDNQVDQTTGTVRMKADFPNANLQLWPGQFVNVRVLIQTLENVIVVPTPAVQRGPSGPFAYVIQADDRVALRPITVQQQTDTQAVIASGIQAGERVVTTGFARLKDGGLVAVSNGNGRAPDTESPNAPTVNPVTGTAAKALPQGAHKKGEGRRKRDGEQGGAMRGEDERRAHKADAGRTQ